MAGGTRFARGLLPEFSPHRTRHAADGTTALMPAADGTTALMPAADGTTR
jgi:hypothetical protein